MRSAMNRFKLLSGIAASLVVLAASAVAQNPGEWTMTGRTPDLQRFSPLTQITMTNAPIVIKDIVIAGISGGEFGVRGRVSAFDVNSGQKRWTMYSTGPDAEVGIEGDANANYASHRGKDLGVSTWTGDEWTRGGGTTWGWYSYDPELNLFYYSSGNPGSWNPDQRADHK